MLVAKEKYPITGICCVPESNTVWVTTTGPDVNSWNDFDVKNSQIVRPLGVKFSKADYEVEIPISCIIQQNGGVYLSTDDVHGKTVDTEIGLTPLCDKPIERKVGGPSFVKYAFLNDRRRVVVLDSDGGVSIWDIVRCIRIMIVSYTHNYPVEQGEAVDAASVYGEGLSPDELFDKVLEANNTLVWIANWCTIDLRIGVSALILHHRVLWYIWMNRDSNLKVIMRIVGWSPRLVKRIYV